MPDRAARPATGLSSSIFNRRAFSAAATLVPLLQIAPSKTDAERLLVISPDLADVLSAIITRLAGPGGTIPLTARYDGHEHLWQPPAPLLFQRRSGTETRPISTGTVRNMLNTALGRTGLTDAARQPLIFTPHDFRRMFITDAQMTGLPPRTAPDRRIPHPHRRGMERIPRPLRTAQAVGRELRPGIRHPLHACLRCPMLWPDPAQRDRIAEIRDNLTARISEAEREGWLGEIQ